MGGGRKNLLRSNGDVHVTLQDGQSIMKVLSLRGSNLIEVMNARGEKLLALFPDKFQKSIWIKRGNFVVVDESGKEKALESGSKVACIVSQVLYHEQVRVLQISAEWPEILKSGVVNGSSENFLGNTLQLENERDSSEEDDDGLPPLEATTNRMRPFELQTDENSEPSSETDA